MRTFATIAMVGATIVACDFAYRLTGWTPLDVALPAFFAGYIVAARQSPTCSADARAV